MSLVKGDLTNAKDASSLVILRRDVVSPLLNLVLNYHLHFLPNLSCRGVANHSRVAECTRIGPEGEYSGVS